MSVEHSRGGRIASTAFASRRRAPALVPLAPVIYWLSAMRFAGYALARHGASPDAVRRPSSTVGNRCDLSQKRTNAFEWVLVLLKT